MAGGIEHIPAYRLRILDDLIGTLAKEVIDDAGGYSAFLEIWNWKHGARGSVSSSLRPPFHVHLWERNPDPDFHVIEAAHYSSQRDRGLLFPLEDCVPGC